MIILVVCSSYCYQKRKSALHGTYHDLSDNTAGPSLLRSFAVVSIAGFKCTPWLTGSFILYEQWRRSLSVQNIL
jgi:hypothetical protein